MKKTLNITYASSLTDLCEVNSSFDSGILRIAYEGDNRNKSHISKDSFLRSLKTIYNCPLVCNYDRETDTLGGHDMDVVRDSNGELRIINVTTPVGCIPESAKTWFEEVEEDDGTIHEYLFAEALLWKRQEAYKKLKKDGVVSQSMEITVKEGRMVDDILYIDEFEFTAFTLIGVEPCFEKASLEMFSCESFKEQLSQMMQDLKEEFSLADTSNDVEDIHPQEIMTEGGENILDKKMELVSKYNIDIKSLDFSIEDLNEDELIAKFEELTKDTNISKPDAQSTNNADPVLNSESNMDGQFALTESIVSEIIMSLEEVKVEREWGECVRYYYVDCDFESNEVYCWDSVDWLLYGFPYSMNGDNIVIDFEGKKRKKYTIVDFDEGEQSSPFIEVFTQLENKLHDSSEFEAKFNEATEKIESMNTELMNLRQFKTDIDKAKEDAEKEAVLARFEDLTGIEAYEILKNDFSSYDVETLEEKCFAIRGRNSSKTNFSLDSKTPRIIVNKVTDINEPYGGLFPKYGYEKTN